MTQTTPIQLTFPELKEESITKIRSYTHAFRQGGPKLIHQVINDKHIFHNYGFGASGTALSFGAASVSSKSYSIFFDITVADGLCAVIGSGILGLMTAIELVKRGRRVTIYAESFPQLNPKQSQKQVISQISPVVWLPNEYDWSQDILKHELVSKLSYEYFRETLSHHRYQSIKEVTVHDCTNDIDDLKENVGKFVCDMFRESSIKFQNGTTEPSTFYKTIRIDNTLFLQELRIQAILRGVKFVQKKFNNFQEILNLQQSAIFNNSGKSSAYLFDDNNFKNEHNLMLQFDHLVNHKNQFVFKSAKKGEPSFQLQCIGKKSTLIIKTKQKVTQKEKIKSILHQVKVSLSKGNPQPKL